MKTTKNLEQMEKPELFNSVWNHKTDCLFEAVGYTEGLARKTHEDMADAIFDMNTTSERAEWVDNNIPKKLLAVMFIQQMKQMIDMAKDQHGIEESLSRVDKLISKLKTLE